MKYETTERINRKYNTAIANAFFFNPYDYEWILGSAILDELKSQVFPELSKNLMNNTYTLMRIGVTVDYQYPKRIALLKNVEELHTHPDKAFMNYIKNDVLAVQELYERRRKERMVPEIDRVIYNNPATIVFWKDGTKTVVKAQGEAFDEEKGLAMAIVKKVYGNDGKYFNKLKKHLPKIEAKPVEEEDEISCKNCKHAPLTNREKPCSECDVFRHSKFEPK